MPIRRHYCKYRVLGFGFKGWLLRPHLTLAHLRRADEGACRVHSAQALSAASP